MMCPAKRSKVQMYCNGIQIYLVIGQIYVNLTGY